ncbi:hypothetical protein NLU13_3555 [Sarocladium strictum]|uniref:NmrA-like domain-containing protein n=1 Tax=Sarocladium strictum TaxID=5046 RepID=A0AA39GPZ8_SARSR|nr:hypothetical protein NLU13_3555 [Sarocladium strictum]
MPVIAVAGGTGGLGRAIVDALNAAGKSKVVVLSRQSSEEKEKEIGAPILAVDYNDVSGLAEILEKNNIDTIISTISNPTGPEPEFALIDAGDKSVVTKRYIPAIWGIPYKRELAPYFPPAGQKLDILAKLEKTSLDYTAVYNGLFLDYYVHGVPSYLSPITFAVDVAHNAAAIPGTGNEPVVFTHTSDVANFVAAYVESSKWEKEVYIIGDKLSLDEFVKLLEEVKGVKFTVSYDSEEDMRAGKVTELPSHVHAYPFLPKPIFQGFMGGMGLMVADGSFDLKAERTLNSEFPSIKPQSVKELLIKAYKS